MTMRMPEGGPRATSGFWCAFWLVSLVAFGALLWQYANVDEDGAVWEGNSESRPEVHADRGDRYDADSDRDERDRDRPVEPLEGDRDSVRDRADTRDREGPTRSGERAPPPAPVVIEPAPRFVANGGYVVQLGAFRAEAAVQPAWERLARRAPELFDRAQLNVVRVEDKERGVFYRMRAGYFADRTNALRFCQHLRARPNDCVPTRVRP
jgi:hypothetical protein